MPRIQFPGAIYHVMSRGNQGNSIFLSEDDYLSFLDTLSRACEKTGWLIHSFVLMSNHYHLLLETPEPNLVDGMKWLQGVYTQRFNKRNMRSGHVLQGRYKALVIDSTDSRHLLTVSNYIHLNPLRAGLCDMSNISGWRWSSYPLFLKDPSRRPEFITPERLFSSLNINVDSPGGRKRYQQYMRTLALELNDEAGRAELERQWTQIRRGWCLGDETFREKLMALISDIFNDSNKSYYASLIRREHGEVEAERIIGRGLKHFELCEEQLPTMLKSDPVKQKLAWLICSQTTARHAWIAERLHMGYVGNVSRYVGILDQKLNEKDKKHLIEAVNIARSED